MSAQTHKVSYVVKKRLDPFVTPSCSRVVGEVALAVLLFIA